MDEYRDGRTEGEMDEYRLGQTDGGMDGQGTDGRTEGWTNIGSDGRKDGGVDGQGPDRCKDMLKLYPSHREYTHSKKFFLVVGPVRFYPPYTNGLVVHVPTAYTLSVPTTKKNNFFMCVFPYSLLLFSVTLYIAHVHYKV